LYVFQLFQNQKMYVFQVFWNSNLYVFHELSRIQIRPKNQNLSFSSCGDQDPF
jgi:hypothetical protein